MMYLGDYASQANVDFMWSSNAADGSSITRATNGTISVYKANSTTQTTTGVSDTEDFDSLTGIHHCRIATTDAFYATGNDYMVVLSGAVIDGKTVNAVLALFSIENRHNPTPPTAAAIADAVWDEATSGHTTAGSAGKALTDANNGAPIAAGVIADAVWDEATSGHTTAGSAGKALTDANNGTPIAASVIADAVWDEATSGHTTAGSAGKALTDANNGTPPTVGAIADAVWDEGLGNHGLIGSAGDALNNAGGAAADPWETELPGGYTAGSAGWILGQRLDAKVSAISGNSPGAGAAEFTYTLTDADTGQPIADADVWATADSTGLTILASGRTNQTGQITFYLDPGTVYLWRQKTGYNFVNPDVEVVA